MNRRNLLLTGAAAAVGALAGGMLGKTIGAKLDDRDRQALAAQTQQVLESGKDGQVTTWTSAHSGATAQITPVSTKTESRQVAVKHHDVRAAAGQGDDDIATQCARAAGHGKGLAGEIVHVQEVVTVHE